MVCRGDVVTWPEFVSTTPEFDVLGGMEPDEAAEPSALSFDVEEGLRRRSRSHKRGFLVFLEEEPSFGLKVASDMSGWTI